MVHDVSSTVRSLIESFLHGTESLGRLQNKTRRLKKTRDQHDDTTRLSHSLRQGSYEIEAEYRRGAQTLGEHYSRGDRSAQHSLTEILLNLNTGLVGIIASLVGPSRRSPTIDYDALTLLSETSRRGSVDVLRKLYQRICSPRPPRDLVPEQRERPKPSSERVQGRGTKIRRPTIAQVTIQGQKGSQLAIVKPTQKRKSPSSSSSHLAKPASYSSSTTAVDSVLSMHRKQPRLQHDEQLIGKKDVNVVDGVRSHKSATRDLLLSPGSLHQNAAPYGLPAPQIVQAPTIARRPRPIVAAPRRPTPTMYSLATDSTKLGEIPMHRWAIPYDFDAMSLKNKAAMQSGWPLTDLDGNAVYKPKKRNRLFSIFRKKQRVA